MFLERTVFQQPSSYRGQNRETRPQEDDLIEQEESKKVRR